MDVSHYITPRGSVRKLFNNVEAKQENFASNDYYAKMIGENDFTTTCDYNKLVALINEKLYNLSQQILYYVYRRIKMAITQQVQQKS